MLDVRAGDQVRLGVGGPRGDLERDAVVSVQLGVVVVLQLGQAGAALVVPDNRVEVYQVRLGLALENVQAEREASTTDGRGIGYGGARKALSLEVRELTDERVVVGADHRYKRLLGRHVLVDDGRVDARGPDSVNLQTRAEDVLDLLCRRVQGPVGEGLLDHLYVRVVGQRGQEP